MQMPRVRQVRRSVTDGGKDGGREVVDFRDVLCSMLSISLFPSGGGKAELSKLPIQMGGDVKVYFLILLFKV